MSGQAGREGAEETKRPKKLKKGCREAEERLKK